MNSMARVLQSMASLNSCHISQVYLKFSSNRARVRKDFTTSRLFKIVLMKHSFDFANAGKHHSFYNRVKVV